ncbi:MAG: hypothetical protein WEF53_00955 [Bacteroidota bacterium]
MKPETLKPTTEEMEPGKKLELSLHLYYSALELKRGSLKHFHPGWSDQMIEEEVRRIFANART